MDRILVQSSNLVSVGYEASTKIMEVEFQTGAVYRYHDIPANLYQSLMATRSKGQFFHDYIMNQYEFEEV
jgi:uncharacterized protein